MTTHCTHTSTRPDAFDICGDFNMQAGSVLNVQMCCDGSACSCSSDGNSGTDPGTNQTGHVVHVANASLAAGETVSRTLAQPQSRFDLQAWALKAEGSAATAVTRVITASAEVAHSQPDQTISLNGDIIPLQTGEIPAGDNIIQPMQSTQGHGQTVTASDGYYQNHLQIWHAFDGRDDTTWFSKTTTHPQTLAIEFDQPRTVTGYRLSVRLDNKGDRIVRFKLQGSNNGLSWTDLDDQSNADVTYTDDWFQNTLAAPASFTHYQLYIEDSAGQKYASTSQFQLFSTTATPLSAPYYRYPVSLSGNMTLQAIDSVSGNSVPMLLHDGSDYYTFDGSALQPASLNSLNDIASQGFTHDQPIDLSSLSGALAIITLGDQAHVTAPQIAYQSIPASLSDLSSLGALTSVSISAPTDSVITVYSSPGQAQRWNGSSWQTSTGPTDGNSAAELAALGAADWAALASHTIGFGYHARDHVSAAAATLQIGNNSNTDHQGGWRLCSPGDIEVRWYGDRVTFTATTPGQYQLAWQDVA